MKKQRNPVPGQEGGKTHKKQQQNINTAISFNFKKLSYSREKLKKLFY